MTIVHYRHKPRKHAQKPKAEAEIAVPLIIKMPTKYDRVAKELPPDLERDASVAAFFARMIQPRSEEQK